MANRFINPAYAPQDDIGRSLPGAQLFTYEPGTTTDKFTFSDEAGTINNANPVVAAADGIFPDIYLDGSYRMILQDADGNEIWDRDNVRAAPISSAVTFELDYLAEAQAADLSGIQYIFIHSELNAPTNPVNGRYFHFTGNVIPANAGTGTIELFYDAAGNEFAADREQRVNFEVSTIAIISDDPAWTPDSNAAFVAFEAIGGGASGGAFIDGGNNSGSSAGGGEGGRVEITPHAPDASYAITIGDGGTATTTDGDDGGDTTIVSASFNITAGGGKKGANWTSAGAPLSGLAEGGVGGTASSGASPVLVNTSNGRSGGSTGIIADDYAGGGYGGGNEINIATNAQPATPDAFGQGGAGVRSFSNAGDKAGGNGKQGVVYITQWIL